MRVPENWKAGAWRIGVGLTAISSLLFGFVVWQRPELLMGIPSNRQSPVERMASNSNIRDEVFELMQEYFFENRPYGLMFVSWEELDHLIGLWVRPADQFPGKAGVHALTPDMRILGGPFLFGECAYTESLALPGKVMVACPIINSYDVWGYVAAIVDDEPETIAQTMRLVGFLANRITSAIY